MDQCVALDVSLRKTSVCVLNSLGRVVTEADVPSEPGALISFIRARAPHASRIGLESGPTSTWLWHALKAAGLPVICMDARHAHAALSVRPIKSDRNDARGLAEMVRVGWFKEVQVKSLAARERMALLGVRRRLVDIRVEIDGQIRGILKTFGRVLPKGLRSRFPDRVREAIDGHPVLGEIIEPTLRVLEAMRVQLRVYDRAVIQRARSEDTARQLMSAPGVGTVVALAYITGVEDPARFKRSSSVAAYFGMTPRRYQSGEIDMPGVSPSAETVWYVAFCSKQPKCCSVGRRGPAH